MDLAQKNESRIFNYISLFCLIIFSAITTIKVAPIYLDADIIMNSIMSIQNLTLYYWGQNRLLNILPLTTYLIREPSLNLSVTLVLASMSLYGLLYFISRSSVVILYKRNIEALSLLTFLVIASSFTLAFNTSSISSMTIGHIEYSLSALLLVCAVLKLYPRSSKINSWKEHLLPSLFVFIAIGINPSSLIASLFIASSFIYYKKEIRKKEITLILATIISFIFWKIISSQYPGYSNYGGFSFETFTSSIIDIINNIYSTTNLATIFSFTSILVLTIYLARKEDRVKSKLIIYSSLLTLFFSVGWLILFSSNDWVKLNGGAVRYFTYINFAFLFCYAVLISSLLKTLEFKKTLIYITIFSLYAIFNLTSSVQTFENFKVFREVSSFKKPEVHLYSGNYWDVWPSVMRDMIDGQDAYGLTYRGESNAEMAKAYINKKITENGYAEIICINDEVESCLNYSKNITFPLTIIESEKLSNSATLIKVIKLNKLRKALKDFSFDMKFESILYNKDIKVKIINNSESEWPAYYEGMYDLALSYAIPNKENEIHYQTRIKLPYDVAPGESVEMSIQVDGLNKGKNTLCFNMVQEGVTWFAPADKFCKPIYIKSQ